VLVRALVQRALEPSPHLVARFDQPRPGRRQLRPGVGVRECLGQQLGERDEPLLAAGRQRLLLRGGGDQRAPRPTVAQHRGGDRGLQADRLHQHRQLAARAFVRRHPRREQRALRLSQRTARAMEVELGVDGQPAHALHPVDADDHGPLAADEAHHRAGFDAQQPPGLLGDVLEQRLQRLIARHEHGDSQQRRLLRDRLDVLDTPDQHQWSLPRRSTQAAQFHAIVAHARLEGGLRRGRGSLQHRPVAAVEA
jgi:hypothetical protein